MWKIIRNCIDYAALHSEIGPDHLCHSFDQSNAKTETNCNLVTLTLWHVWNVDFPRVLIDFFGQTLWPVGQCAGLAFSEKNAVLAQWKSPGSTNGYWQIVRED